MNTSNSLLKFYELRRKGFLEGSFRRLTFVLELVIYSVDPTVAPACAAGSFLSLFLLFISVKISLPYHVIKALERNRGYLTFLLCAPKVP